VALCCCCRMKCYYRAANLGGLTYKYHRQSDEIERVDVECESRLAQGKTVCDSLRGFRWPRP
jgi:hypothetical protein